KNKELCPRYTARVITGVRVKGSAGSIRERVLAMGMRPVNNVADITNYCLMETGQPMHAFDLDKIKGGKVIVREAAAGEKIVTIDGIERELKPGMLVIADGERPIAIAGVMGGKDTEVTENTRNILLESAYFDPLSVRRTARALGLSSDSSYRFERGVDKGMIARASERAASLIVRETGGKAGIYLDEGSLVPETVSIEFSIAKAGRILGISLAPEKVKKILRRLGMDVAETGKDTLNVRVPSFREDIRREIDIVEEVARIYGYDNIPAEIRRLVPEIRRKERSREVMEKIYQVLPSMGLNEIMTYSLISESSAQRFASIVNGPVRLSNPLSEEQKVLTPQLVDGMLRSISWNINRKNIDLALFEIGKIYKHERKRGKAGFQEIPVLCIGLTGTFRKNWQDHGRDAGLYDVKGFIEATVKTLKLAPEFVPAKADEFINYARIRVSGKEAGFLGEVSPEILKGYDISQRVYVSQAGLDGILADAVLENVYHAVPRFPFSSRDISVLCDRTLAAGDIRKVILSSGEDIIRDIDLIDVYEGDRIPAGRKSLTYSIKYGMDTRTLTEEEIEAVHAGVKDALAAKLKVTFR
ncbi:MAG: phenylalanine--tRNA ligase subunit beta, partial [Candidatus Omnitrophota bacterium]